MSDTTKTITPTVAELRELAQEDDIQEKLYANSPTWSREHSVRSAALTRWADEIERNEKQNTNSTKENTQ
jgi:hypothetical protein